MSRRHQSLQNILLFCTSSGPKPPKKRDFFLGRLKWMKEELKPAFLNNVKCHRPALLQGSLLEGINVKKLKCSGIEKRATTFCSISAACPSACTCSQTTVDCRDRGLKHIPADLPSYTRELRLEQNQITSIDRGAFRNLANLTRLDLSKNHIYHIDEGAFQGLTSLTTLMLFGNNLTYLPEGIFEPLSSELQLLLLNTNRLQCLHRNTFKGMKKLALLSLYDNLLGSLTNGTFNFNTLETLHLAKNPLSCDCKLAWLESGLNKRQIETSGARCVAPPKLSRQRIGLIGSEKFKCDVQNEAVSIIDGCREASTQCPTGCKCLNRVVRCSKIALHYFPTDIPSDTTELYLDANQIEAIDANRLRELPSLTKLDISHNRIKFIANGTFDSLSRLQTLILSFNSIKCIGSYAFAGLKSLRVLSLHGNQLSQLSESAFESVRPSMTHIALGSNPLICDCQMAWFSRWIKTKLVEPGTAKCEGPGEMQGQLIFTAAEDQFKCVNSTPQKQMPVNCDVCVGDPCMNNGHCDAGTLGNFSCHCSAGWYGNTCQHKIDACYGAPCLNNATCELIDDVNTNTGRFKCRCAEGYTGERCEMNIDDCKRNDCQNSATCLDGINTYSCKCPIGYFGQFCEKAVPYAMALHTGDAVDNDSTRESNFSCSKENCKNGHCQDESGRCECFHGYGGTECDQQISVGFRTPGAYLSLAGWPAAPSSSTRNITLELRTKNSSGVLLYYGDTHYISAELYNGRVKLALYAGNYPSHMYSYTPVNDGRMHRLQLVIDEGRRLSMKIDNGEMQKVVNSGKTNSFEGATRVYLGGLPKAIATKALIGFHLIKETSLIGCLSNIRINDKLADLEDSETERHETLAGCASAVDLCSDVDCGRHGLCLLNSSVNEGYSCVCRTGFYGVNCSERNECVKRKVVDYIDTGDCRSVEPVKTAACLGVQGLGLCRSQSSSIGTQLLAAKSEGYEPCCTAIKTKRKRVKMRCKDGQIKMVPVEIVRRCGPAAPKSILNQQEVRM